MNYDKQTKKVVIVMDQKVLQFSGSNGAPPVISIVGKSGSGKTTLLEKLIPEIKRRGWKVGAIKHDAHRFEIDHPGKDSYRLKNCGASAVLISSSTKLAFVSDTCEDTSLFTLRDSFFRGFDMVLTEGYKIENPLRIEISRRDNTTELICGPGECMALVADWSPDGSAPVFGLDDVEKVADLIEDRFLKTSEPKYGTC